MDVNIKQIKALAQIFKETGLTELEVSIGDASIKLAKHQEVQVVSSPIAPARQAYAYPGEPPEPVEEAIHARQSDPGVDFNNVTPVESPMVGVFYQAAGPGETPFVELGQKVKKGDVLCIIEAMKLMNEITAPQDGEIVDICAGDGDVVEYGQTLFKLF